MHSFPNFLIYVAIVTIVITITDIHRLYHKHILAPSLSLTNELTIYNLYPDISFLNKFYWRIVDLKYCISFRCTAKQISYTYRVYIYPFFFRFFSHIGYYRILSKIPCAIQQVLLGYLFILYARKLRLKKLSDV